MDEIPVDEFTAAVAQVERRVAEVRGHSQSPDRLVRVEVGADGRITNLQLAPESFHYGTGRLTALIMESQAAACADAAGQARELRRELTDDPRVARLADKLGTKTAAQRAEPAHAGRRRTAPEVDDARFVDSFFQDPLGRDRR